jgi:glycerol-3-phosphate dehydrogenase
MRRADASMLTGTVYDVMIVGGGIFGVCAAWDAAQRGLSSR